ncbi:MAG: threonine--tRNA ligase [Desulfarculales bacterium]|nr:threonine--tRNA ligase [Desulfarculales bacterium]
MAELTAAQLLAQHNPDQARTAIAVRIEGQLLDLSALIPEETRLEAVLPDDPEAMKILRHSTAHIMAQAVQELFPGVKIAIGPAIADGFYYDFEYERSFTPDDLPVIEDKMRRIINSGYIVERQEWNKEEALAYFQDQPYKQEIISSLAGGITVYRQGDFVDLCRGPHLPSTARAGSFKLLSVAGAYWRGDEKNSRLSRIYGTAFFEKRQLKEYLSLLEEARRRDHRKLGKDLELFGFSDEAGAGLAIWHPRGMLLRYLIEEFERQEHLRRGYHMVQGPQILKSDLWKKSGHLDYYSQNMYFTEIDEMTYALKPMNCVAHMLIYQSKIRSYRELPLRYFELGTVHRHERSGVLHGLSRVRAFTQDDAHILCTPEQVQDEIWGVMNFITDVMGIFGFEYSLELSTRPDGSIGSDADWELATNALLNVLGNSGHGYKINEGDGAFYGPKIDVKIKDALKREWQCATIQCDFTLPERFDLHYTASDGSLRRPVMLHRVILGSIERFIGILIEHYAGAFPLWLAPEQVRILTVTDRADAWAMENREILRAAGIRAEVDLRNEKLGAKVRDAQVFKLPYMVIAGDQEVESNLVTARLRCGANLPAMTIEEFINRLRDETQKKQN